MANLEIALWRLLPETKEMAEDSFLEDRNFFRFNDVLDRERRVIPHSFCMDMSIFFTAAFDILLQDQTFMYPS